MTSVWTVGEGAQSGWWRPVLPGRQRPGRGTRWTAGLHRCRLIGATPRRDPYPSGNQKLNLQGKRKAIRR
jgi:hypothetical protein